MNSALCSNYCYMSETLYTGILCEIEWGCNCLIELLVGSLVEPESSLL